MLSRRRLSLLSTLLFSVFAHPVLAQTDFDPHHDLSAPSEDISMALLTDVLGSVIPKIQFAQTLSAEDHGAFGEMFSLFNGFMLFLLAVFLFVKFVSAALDTAHQGEVLGRERSTTWSPLRIVLGVSMLIPMVNGFAFIQVIVLWAALSGIGLASHVWELAVDKFAAVSLYQQPPPPQARNLAVSLLASNVCELVIEALPARGDAAYEVKKIQRDGPVGAHDERWVRWSVKGMGAAACGGFIIREPHREIKTEQALTGVEASDGFLAWVMDLLGFSDEVRAQFAAALMPAHEQATLAMREELRPLAEKIVAGVGDLQECVEDPTGGLSHVGCISLIDAAAEHYVINLQAAIASAVNDAGERSFDAFSDTAKAEGWLTAGSWFYRLAALSDYMNKLALNVPSPFPITAWDKLPQEDVETYRFVIARLQAVITEAETDAGVGLTEGDPNNSQLDDVSRGFLRAMMDWIKGGLFGETHPIFSISWLGHAILAAILSALFATKMATALWSGSKLVKAAGGLLDALTTAVQPNAGLTMTGLILGIIALALISFALMAAIYLPLIPFIIWAVGVLHWLILVFEALLAAPVWAIWYLRNGDSFTSEMMNGYLLIFSLLLRPVLMVFGLLAATIISYYLLSWLNGAFTVAAINAASGNTTGVVVITGILVVFVLVSIEITLKCFSLIHRLPDFILRWIGGAMDNAIDAADMRARSESAMRAGSENVTSALGRSATQSGAPEVKRLSGGEGSIKKPQ